MTLPAPQADPTTARRAFAGHVGAWLGLALLDFGVRLVERPQEALGLRLAVHAIDLGQLLLLGLSSGAVAYAWRRYGPERRGLGLFSGLLLLTILAIVVAERILWLELLGAAGHTPIPWEIEARIIPALFALSVPAAAGLAYKLGPTKLGPLCVIAGLGLGAAHQLLFPNLYPGIHTFATWVAALLVAEGSQGLLARPVAFWDRRSRWVRRATLAVAVALGLVATVAPIPPNAATRLRQIPGAVVARHVPRWDAAGVASARVEGPWYRSRAALPAIPATAIPWAPDKPIVLLVLVDALRADVLMGDEAEHMPALRQLAASGLQFRRTWSIAPGTAETVSGLLAGKYPSQLHWARQPTSRSRKMVLWPKDESVRVANLLNDAGVATSVVKGMPGFALHYGLTQGIAEVTDVNSRRAKTIAHGWLRWVDSHKDRASFCYVHFIEAHRPYDLAGTEGTLRERYLRELTLADQGIEAIMKGIAERGLSDRLVLIVSADHGEGFGEHNAYYHGTTLYEEMVRVPLVIHHPALHPRVVDSRVSLIDLAPTILDLFGVATPGSYMGQTLAPVLSGGALAGGGLAGGGLAATRPIYLDSQRGLTGMVFEDGHKLLVDDGLPELYDLDADPGEEENIYDGGDHARRHLGELRAFEKAHQMVPVRRQ